MSDQTPDTPAETTAPAESQTAAPVVAQPVETAIEQPAMAEKIGDLLDGIGKEQEAKPDDPAEKPALKVEDKPADKPQDKTEDPPDDAGPRAKSRWMELSDRAKQVPELERRATEAETALTAVRGMVAESGLGEDEFRGLLQMGKLFNSSKPEDLQAAMAQIDTLRADLATRLGVEAPGIDLLAKHPDLQGEVEGMTLTRERAIEIAKLRDQGQRQQQESAATQEVAQFQATVRNAAAQMDATLAQRASTPGHEQKVAFIRSKLQDQATIQRFVSTYRPEQWGEVIMMMYDAYTPPPPAAAAAPQPLRPGVVQSGTRQSSGRPITTQEAVTNAWAAAGL